MLLLVCCGLMVFATIPAVADSEVDKLREEIKELKKQVEEIARLKLPDLNTDDIEAAVRIVEGTARNMGIEIVEG